MLVNKIGNSSNMAKRSNFNLLFKHFCNQNKFNLFERIYINIQELNMDLLNLETIYG